MRTSYNGWTASPNPDDVGIVPLVVSGVSFPGGVRGGNVEVVLRYVLEQFDRRVEVLKQELGCWGFAYRQNRNANNLSCHSSGTAVDANAVRHPNGKRRTFTTAQVTEIRRILAEVGGVVKWGGDFTGTPDEMHFEVSGTPAEVSIVARRLKNRASLEEPDMTPEQAKQLEEVHKMLKALTAPRRPDKKDTDQNHLGLGDVLTAVEKGPVK